jgi:lipopolysaccharide transport system permease protein
MKSKCKNYSNSSWTTFITPKKSLFDINLKEIWDYRDLIAIFVKRDIVSIYKQTILGPIWFLFGPLFTVFTYTFLFSEVAHLSTDGLPGPLFYLGGTTLWNYFQACFNGASTTFSANAGIFGKVYFPRLVTPISMVISNLLKLTLQFVTYFIFLTYYASSTALLQIHFKHFLFIPFIILILAMIAMGIGIIISSFTYKYKDLNMLIGIGMTLLMYATPIMYPTSAIPSVYKPFLGLNPISPLIEYFRYICTGHGFYSLGGLFYSFLFGVTAIFFGVLIFNRTEKSFMDTI